MGVWKVISKNVDQTLPRKSQVTIRYAGGSAAGAEIQKYLEGFTYSDPATGESDTASIDLANIEMDWANRYLPKKGDKFEASIEIFRWESAAECRRLTCGTFCCDDRNFTFPKGCTATINGVSVPEKQAFRSTNRSKTWQDVTLRQIAADIASRYGLALSYTAPEIRIGSKEQNGKDDCGFLMGLCSDYGMYIKVYSGQIVIYDAAEFEKKAATTSIDFSEVISGDYNSTLSGTYNRAEIKYADGDEESTYTYTVDGPGSRTLAINENVDSLEDARIKAKARLEEENRKAETLKLTVACAGRNLFAGGCFLFAGAYELSGKYFIDRITHKVSASGGYSADIEAHRVYGSSVNVRKIPLGKK